MRQIEIEIHTYAFNQQIEERSIAASTTICHFARAALPNVFISISGIEYTLKYHNT
jgi:hypothetical protein